MGDWDDEDFEVQLPPSVAVQAPIAEDDAEEVDKALETVVAAPPAVGGPAKPEQLKPKHLMKELARRQEEERTTDKAKQNIYTGPEGDVAARRRWEEEQAQQADLALAMDALAVAPQAAAPPPPGADVTAYVDMMPLSDVASYKEAGTKMAARACRDGITTRSSEKALSFFREALKTGAEKLPVEDLKVLTDILDVFRNKKLSDARGKKKGASKPKATGGSKLMMERDDDYLGAAEAAMGNFGSSSAAAEPSAPAAGAAADGTAEPPAADGSESWRVQEDFM